MATNNCGTPCGCTDTYVVTPPCPPTCPEVVNAQCVVYTGTDILCNTQTIVSRYEQLDSILANLVSFVCAAPKKYVTETNLVNNTATTITHNLGNVAVLIQLVDITTNALIKDDDYTVTSYALNTVTVTRTVGSGNTRVIIIG